MAGVFDSKIFNAEVFGKYVEQVPDTKRNALLKAGVLRERTDLAAMLPEQSGGNFITVPLTGIIGGDALNYDGSTNITATALDTFSQGMIVVGRAKAWQEKDFSFDITGHDFMADIAAQVSKYWDNIDQLTILKILEGIFGVSTDSFSSKHTLDLTGETVKTVDAVSLNNAVQKSSGDNKDIFRAAIMHSAVATNLENLQVLTYWKETDANGVQRPVAMASWNGRTVLIDDSVPVSEGTYTTYILGENAFDYCNVGAKVPYEPYRDPTTYGGQDMLISRQRKIFAPRGFSFVQPSTPIVSPTDAQLATAARWTPIKNSAGNAYFDTKAIPIARILSKG